VSRLENFLSSLDSRFRYAVEFRDPSWISPEVEALLAAHQVASVALSSLRMPDNRVITTDFAYVRFHGLEGGAAHDYTDQELQPWADFLKQCIRSRISAFVYFNNDVNTRAPWNAQRLAELVGIPLAGMSAP
jgi:uncharacterized protein YecE (DUF72 family)